MPWTPSERAKGRQARTSWRSAAGVVLPLMRASVVDGFVLSTHAWVMGSGQRLFRRDGLSTELRFVGTRTTTMGGVIATSWSVAADQAAGG